MDQSKSSLRLRTILQPGIFMLLSGGILFLAAGTFAWPLAWAYTLLATLSLVGSRLVVARKNPDLIIERARHEEVSGVMPGDRQLVGFIALYGPLAMLVVAGLDFRLGWTPLLPAWLPLTSLAICLLGNLFGSWAFIVNRFFSALVRIQTERGQTICTDGPYRFVRHPGYAGGALYYLATPLALGSFWALIPVILTVALMVIRTGREDRLLQAELPGYAEYAQRVRYRLLPGVW